MKINANGTEISVMNANNSQDDYLCLTDLARRKNPYEPKDVVKNWLRLRSTIEFLVLKGSNSTPLKTKPVQMLLPLRLNVGLKKRMPLESFPVQEEAAVLMHIKILLLNSHLGFRQNLNYMLLKIISA